jgi:hypothetical protein
MEAICMACSQKKKKEARLAGKPEAVARKLTVKVIMQNPTQPTKKTSTTSTGKTRTTWFVIGKCPNCGGKVYKIVSAPNK